MLYVEWIIGSMHLEDTDQHLSLRRFIKAFFNYYQLHTMGYKPDQIILQRMMTALDLEFKSFTVPMMKGMRVTITLGYHTRSQGLSVFTLYSQQRHPSTQLTLPKPSAHFILYAYMS